ncbi:MAG TPA: hypothetical protein VH643_20995 [Gemmataceae bacterium]
MSDTRILCRGSRKLAFVALDSGQWVFRSLVPAGSTLVRHNRQPMTARCPLAVGDLLDLNGLELVVHSVETASGERPAERDHPSPRETAIAEALREKDPVYRKAKELCHRLLPVLRDEGRAFPSNSASSFGIRRWLRLLRRPSGPAETLDRLEWFLSGSPRNRVWLIELCRFLYQQSFVALSLRVARSLCRLHPLDGELMQMLAKLYYRHGCDLGLSPIERLNAFEAAEKCTGVARRLAPDARLLADLQWAVRAAQKILRGQLAEMAYGETPLERKVNALEGIR